MRKKLWREAETNQTSCHTSPCHHPASALCSLPTSWRGIRAWSLQASFFFFFFFLLRGSPRRRWIGQSQVGVTLDPQLSAVLNSPLLPLWMFPIVHACGIHETTLGKHMVRRTGSDQQSVGSKPMERRLAHVRSDRLETSDLNKPLVRRSSAVHTSLAW